MGNSSSRRIDAGSANPIAFAELLEPLPEVKLTTATLTYEIEPQPRNEAALRQLLSQIGRPLPSTALIVLSAGGSTQLIGAFYWAVSQLAGREVQVQSRTTPPYYALHQTIAGLVQGVKWVDATIPLTQVDVQVIVSPNNPTGELNSPSPDLSPASFVLLDKVYDSPQFVGPVTVNPWESAYYASTDRFCSIGSVSKLGLAGLRVGYAATRHPELARLMLEYVQASTLGTSSWSMAGLESSLSVINKAKIGQMYDLLKRRHAEIRAILPPSLTLSPSTAVPFILVNITQTAFATAGLIVNSGTAYRTSPEYSRIQLMVAEADWKPMLNMVRKVVRQL